MAAAVTALACSGTPEDTKPLATASSGPAAAAPAKSTAPAVTYTAPVAADFKISLKILRKKCFGSAGCNVNYRVELKQVSAKVIDPSKTYEISYLIKGGDSPESGTLTITDGSYSVIEESTSTPGSKTPTIAITEIAEA